MFKIETKFLVILCMINFISAETKILNIINLSSECNCNQLIDSSIYIDGKNITSIDGNTFKGLLSLKVLSMPNNLLKSIEENTFSGLTNLETLWLCKNQLESIDPAAFKELTLLQELSLSDNQLRSINASTFNGLVHLEKLYLSNNQLKSIDATTFKDLTSLYFLKLTNNIRTATGSAENCFHDFRRNQNIKTEIFKDFAEKALLILGSQLIAFSSLQSNVCLYNSKIELDKMLKVLNGKCGYYSSCNQLILESIPFFYP